MPTTSEQDGKFIDELIPNDLLEQAIDWIGSNLSPEDVFSEADLRTWADENGFVEE